MSQDQRRMEIERWNRRELNAYAYRLELEKEQLQAELTKEREAKGLLIEERERRIIQADINIDIGQALFESNEECEKLKAKVTEQDKEIQALKDQNTVLDDKLNELESSLDICTRCEMTIIQE